MRPRSPVAHPPVIGRVLPDVPALDRELDYVVPDDLLARVRVGTVVRVPLHGRRVRGWVTGLDVAPSAAPERLLPVAGVVSEGPDAATLALARWAAHRWVGPWVALARAASPPNVVATRATPPPPTAAAPVGPGTHAADREADRLAARARLEVRSVLRWPPLVDRRRLVAGLLPEEGSALVVTADGIRSAALVEWLRARGHDAVHLRSDLPATARTEAWRRATGGRCVVVGGRAAVWAPVPDLAAAVVVDDADEALQEERAPTWHARDVLLERAGRAGARCTVISPAPTVVTLARGGTSLTADEVTTRAGWPRVQVVDRRLEPPGAGLFGDEVARAIRAGVEGGAPVVCVLNRRGRARLLACGGCGALVRWDRHGPPVWSDGGVAGQTRPAVCPECGSTALKVLRAGVTRVREELAALLAGVRVVEVDAASGAVPDVPVLVGTEAVLHRAEVRRRRPRLVVFLEFDQELLAPRYRAAEEALWLIVRAAHLLAARPRGETRVVLSTRRPDHPVVVAATAGDPGAVAAVEQERRDGLGLPPAVALAAVSGDAVAVTALLDGLAAGPGSADVEILGPRPAGERLEALVTAVDHERLAGALRAAAGPARAAGRVRIHVDPPRA